MMLALVAQPLGMRGQTRDDVSITFSEQGYTNAQSLNGVLINMDGNISIQFDKNTGSTEPAYYNTGTAARLYGGNTLTITPNNGCTITGMTLTFSSTSNVGTLSASAGTYSVSSTTGTWTGSSNEAIVITNTASSGHARIKILAVTYSAGGSQQSVATPTFSPEAGTYTTAQNVTISCTTTGATVYYTTDGTVPTTSSLVYSTPIAISQTTTVKAMAVKSGMNNSSIATAVYSFPVMYANIAAWKAAHTATSSVVSGISGDLTAVFQSGTTLYVQDATGGLMIYGSLGKTYNNGDVISGGVLGTSQLYNGTMEFKPTSTFPDGVAGTAVEPVVVTVADILADYSAYADRFVKIEGITFDADHTFATNNTAGRTATFTQGESTMTCYDSFKVLGGFEVTEGENADIIGLVGCYNTTKQIFPRSTGDIIPQIAPTYYTVSVATGIVNGTVTADPTSAVEDATITVTATPAENYELATLTYTYNETTVNIDQATMQFVMPAANVTVNATFSLIPAVATPTFTPEGGEYTEAQSVTIACTTEGATIYYTLDGTDPTTESTVYTAAFELSETTTVKALAAKEGMLNSEIVSATYTINIVPPTPTLTFNKLASHNDVTDTGVYMIVDVAGGYAMTSANGTGGAPSAVAVTIENDAITGQIDEALQWNIKAVEGGYTINPINAETFLYTTNTNNGVRVGTNDNKVWELDITDNANYHGFKNVATSRYIGVYNNQDWRTYTTIHNNIKNTQMEIFVLGEAPVHTYYTVSVADSIANGTVTAAPASAEAGDTITVTAQPALGYELATLTYTYGTTTSNINMETMKFVMPASDVTVNATFTELAAVATPTFTPAAGSYISVQLASIACATEGATIYYTLDGTDPTTESAVYAEAFTVSTTTTVKAFAVKEGMNNSAIASVTYTIIEPMTIAAARALENNQYALVQGIVTFIDGRNIYVQDATAGIDLYLNNNTVPTTLALGDMVKGYGKKTVYNGLTELTAINGSDENQFLVLSSGNPLPVAVKTIAEILEDHAGDKMLQSTRVQIVDATVGTINNANNTPITQGESTLNIYKLPVVEGLLEGDIMTVTGIVGCYNNPQLRVASATDVTFAHPAGITITPTALSGFNYVYDEGPSTIKTFVISGMSLTAPTHIYASESYEISSFPGDSFYPESHITINTYTGVYNYTIKVRLKAGLEMGDYEESLVIAEAELDTMYLALSGSVTAAPVVTSYARLSDLSTLTSGSKVIFAARYNENANEYYAMTAQASGKPEGVLFTSVVSNGETLPEEITNAEATYYWTVDVNGDNYTFTNANGDVLGYTSSTNFATGGDNTAWTITYQTSEAGAMVPNYSAFVVNNVNVAVRAIALNSNHNFGPYHTQNMAADNYNFFLDMFATVGGGTLTCATPTFTPEAGTYYEAQEVAIACNTADATIYYTLDGSDPDENSEVYTEPIAVEESMTIKAIAMKEGYENSNIASAEYTIILGAVTIFEQDWEGDMNGWTFVTVEGGNAWTIAQYSGNHYAYANGYNGGVNEQWCISPAFSLNVYGNASLSFRNAKNYNGPDVQLFFSNDYDGENPATATWTELEFNKSTGSYAWVESGTIDLANFSGENCYIGFKYTSTETEAAAWEIDDITLMGFTSEPYLTVTPSALSGFTYIVGNGPSQVQTFTVSGGNLPPAPGGSTGGITITCSNTHYEFSLDGEVFWPYTIGIQATGTLEPTTVYVRLEAGLYVGQWDGVVTFEDGGLEVTATVSGTVTEEPIPGGDWNRIYALGDLHDGDQVILASRYDATVGDGYYAMPAVVSGKPDGMLFTSVNEAGVEKLPSEIADDADTYLWNVIMNGDVITLVNAAGDSLGYSSSTNFSGNVQTEWNIAIQTSGEGAMIPNYTGFVITNGETTNRGIAKNASHKFGAYATSNMTSSDYNFFLDLFVSGGTVTPTVATPVFSMASGTYFEEIDVEISCATEGATIYYTLDGTDPTAESEVYAEAIHVDSDITIKAIAMMEGYDNSGIASASYVIMTDVVVLASQDWEGEMNGWTFVTIEGNKPWTIGTYGGNHYANANGYGDDVDNEQWCISPAFNLNERAYQNVTLTFMNATKFNGPALELYFSNDYNGNDPGDATWMPLEYIASEGNYVWAESGEISLDEFSGENCYIAFRYISTIADGAAAWEVDDILITAEIGSGTITPDALSDVSVWNSHNELMIVNNGNETLKVVVYNLVGHPVLSETVATGNNVIRHNLAEGVYIVRIANGKEMKGVKVIVRR